jgi:hypothetical protein
MIKKTGYPKSGRRGISVTVMADVGGDANAGSLIIVKPVSILD